MTERKPGGGFWLTITLLAVLLYPLSFGPACWLTARGMIPKPGWTYRAYWPILRLAAQHPKTPIKSVLRWYASAGAPADSVEIEIIWLKAFFAYQDELNKHCRDQRLGGIGCY
jgi:hypothetical protein